MGKESVFILIISIEDFSETRNVKIKITTFRLMSRKLLTLLKNNFFEIFKNLQLNKESILNSDWKKL